MPRRRAFNRGDYLDAATRAARFLIEELKESSGRVLRYYKEEQSSVPAYLEDYALLASGCLALYTQTLEQEWLEESYALGQSIIELFFEMKRVASSTTGGAIRSSSSYGRGAPSTTTSPRATPRPLTSSCGFSI